jgi:hypothetical protein
LVKAPVHDGSEEQGKLAKTSDSEVLKGRLLLEGYVLGLDGQAKGPVLESWAYLGGMERDLWKVCHQLETIARKFPRTRERHGEAISAEMWPQAIHYDGAVSEFDRLGYRSSIHRAISARGGDRLVVTTSSKGAVKAQLVQKLNEVVAEALQNPFPGFPLKQTVTSRAAITLLAPAPADRAARSL